MNYISSSSNKLIKDFKSLKDKKGRKEQNSFFIEGTRFFEEAVIEAVKGRAVLKEIFIAESLSAEKINELVYKYGYKKPLSVTVVADKVFNDMSDTETPQGVLAVLEMKKQSLQNLIKATERFLIIDSIQDPGNLGTIIRTADAAGFNGIISSRGTVEVYNPKVLRSTMGSIFRVPYLISENLESDIKYMKEIGIKIIGTHLRAKSSLYQANLKGRLAFVIGNEGAGMSDMVTNLCNELIRIPMSESSESLNAAIAGAIVMYETVRQCEC